MVSGRDKKVLTTSLHAVAGMLAFLLINFLLDGRVPPAVRLGLGVWVMQLITFPATENYGKVSFAKWVGQSALYVLVGMIIYSLIKYLWQHL
ncbi:MAG TPA: hypothetical protein VER76_05120 [Pyrinomonadaceae bacterium]|nr:hypothetical protein [Pyrinomonadaceae bacterium]